MRAREMGVEWRHTAARAEAGLTLFTARYTDLVDFDFDAFQHVNRAHVRAEGAEFHVASRLGSLLDLAADVTWQRTEDLATGMGLLRRPEWSTTGRLTCRPSERLDLHLDVSGVSSSADRQLPVPERERIEASMSWGFGIGWKPAQGDVWRLEARVNNLTNERYETLIGFPAPGRSAGLRLRWRWGDTGSKETQ
jgi:outer membrane cobalamin receptor